MGVETRRGSLYLYTAHRVGRRVVKGYVGPLSEWDAQLVRHRGAIARERRTTLRIDRLHAIAEGAAVLAALDQFDRLADREFRAVMHLLGYRRHSPRWWRRNRKAAPMSLVRHHIDTYGPKKPAPALVKIAASDPEVRKVLDAAAEGDASALPTVRELLKDPGWLTSLGSVAWMAKQELIRQAAGDNLAVREGVTRKYEQQVERLTADDGPDPPYPIRLAATRVVHCWLAVHILEAKSTRHKVGTPSGVAVERQLAAAERRLAAALKSLAVLRRLNRPRVVAQVNVSAGPMVVANG